MPRLIKVGKDTYADYYSRQELHQLMDVFMNINKDSKRISSDMRREIDAYHHTGVCSKFLQSVLENDLKSAVSRGSETERDTLASIVMYISTVLPSVSYGTATKVREWKIRCNDNKTQLPLFDNDSTGTVQRTASDSEEMGQVQE